jgi:type I restriction enzyme, S subunit
MADSALSNHAEIVMGQSPPGEACNAAGRGLPLLNGPTEYGPHHPTPVQFTTDARKRAREGDILFCVRGSTTGRMNWADREYAIGRGVAAIRHKNWPELQPFVRAVIEHGLPGLLAQATGSTFPNVSANQLAGLWWPPLDEDEQRAIAHILGTLDGKIELNRRTNETLEAIARALFKSWFVDFDPVRAKSEGHDPGLPQHLADPFPNSFEDSELGEIPKGWRADSAYRIARVLYGAPFKSKLFNDRREGRPLIRIRDLGTHDPGVFTPEEHPRGYLVQPGDLVVGMDGEFQAHLWRGPEAWLNQRLCCFKPAATVPRAFVHYSIESLLDFFERSKTGTTVIHLGKADIDTFRVLVPSDPVLRAFASLVGPLDSRVVATAQESRVLTALRDTLLPRVMSGELSAASIGRSAEASA